MKVTRGGIKIKSGNRGLVKKIIRNDLKLGTPFVCEGAGYREDEESPQVTLPAARDGGKLVEVPGVLRKFTVGPGEPNKRQKGGGEKVGTSRRRPSTKN